MKQDELLSMGMTEQEYQAIEKIEEFIQENRNDKDLASEIYHFILNDIVNWREDK